MKTLFICLTLLLSITALHAGEARLTGLDAKKAFTSLENQYEYKSGASVTGLKIETIVRHDKDSISCSKESVQYGEVEATVTYECIMK